MLNYHPKTLPVFPGRRKSDKTGKGKKTFSKSRERFPSKHDYWPLIRCHRKRPGSRSRFYVITFCFISMDFSFCLKFFSPNVIFISNCEVILFNNWWKWFWLDHLKVYKVSFFSIYNLAVENNRKGEKGKVL